MSRRGGEELMVPRAEFQSYYGRPVLKTPVWTHDIAAYLFTGGLAAGSSLLAAGADLTDRPALRRAGRTASMGALLASGAFLVKDLGRPERFLNMLRVARPTSPMSMGSWILTVYGGAAGAAAVAEMARPLVERGRFGAIGRLVATAGRPAGLAAAAVSPALATYTAVLLSDTAVPSWHKAYPELPFVFAGSALASGAGVGLIAAPTREVAPAQRMAVLGAAVEMVAARSVRHRMGLLSEPYRTGRPGRLLHMGEVLTAAGVAGSVVGRRSRAVRILSGDVGVRITRPIPLTRDARERRLSGAAGTSHKPVCLPARARSADPRRPPRCRPRTECRDRMPAHDAAQPRHIGTWGRCTSDGSDATLHLAADGRIAVHVNLLGR